MSDTTELSALVQIRLPAQRLKHLTNHNSTAATTINTDVLEASCDDAIGEFMRITGAKVETTNRSQIAILIQGVLSFLESYMNRESVMAVQNSKRFFAACSSWRKASVFSPVGSTPLQPSAERTNARPDMDRSRRPFRTPATATDLRNRIDD